jgi:hypothetical protein
LTCLGVFAAVLLAGRLAEDNRVRASWMLGILLGLSLLLYQFGAGKASLLLVGVFVAGAILRRIVRPRREPKLESAGLMRFAGVVVPLAVAFLLMRAGSLRKDLMGPPPPPDEQTLYEWCRTHTSGGEKFIIPPTLGGFRLGACRAVVIDWKCMPILPKDTVEWYRRLVDVCGTEFDTLSEASCGYARMDAGRARRLAVSYGARYVITLGDVHEGEMGPLRCVYESPAFTVYDLGPDTPFDRPVLAARP